MIIKITKQTVHNNHVIKTFIPKFVQCEQIELDLLILPKIKKLIAINNKHYDFIGSDNRCQYEIKLLNVNNVEDAINSFNQSITDGINTYNQLVRERNVDIKKSNKDNNRSLSAGLLTLLDERAIVLTELSGVVLTGLKEVIIK